MYFCVMAFLAKRNWDFVGGFLPQRCNPQVLVLDKPIIHFKDKALLRTRAV